MSFPETHYIEYDPPPSLSPFLHCYWSYLSKSPQNIANRNPVIPDGCVDIIFDLNLPTQSQCFIVGPMTKSLINKKSNLFGIRFKPGMASSFTNSPVNSMTDQIVDITTIKNYKTSILADKLAYAKSYREREVVLNSIFTKAFPSQPLLEKQIECAIACINKSGGGVGIQDVANKVGWSRQHLTRKFLYHIGLTPKYFSQVVRVNAFIDSYKNNKQYSSGDLAQICGYYDQAHMINEFKKVTGITPENFIQNL